MGTKGSLEHGVYCARTGMASDYLLLVTRMQFGRELHRGKKIKQPVLSCWFFRGAQENQGNRCISVVVVSDSQV